VLAAALAFPVEQAAKNLLSSEQEFAICCATVAYENRERADERRSHLVMAGPVPIGAKAPSRNKSFKECHRPL
jgi:hypothetical protein